MPEGDSVFRLAARLRIALDGRELTRVELRARRAVAPQPGTRVLEHETHGKHLLTRFDDGSTLHTHLRMDGSWTVVRPGRRLPARLDPDVRVVLATRGGPTAYGLRLPVVETVSTRDEHHVVGHLGPDPLRADWDPGQAVARLAGEPARSVLEALRDQRNLAGLGNLWVNELCFLRGLHPATPVGDVDLPPLVALAARVLQRSAGHPEAYQITTGDRRRGRQHWVTGRASKPCLRCGTLVRAVTSTPSWPAVDLTRAGAPAPRRIYWCPRCQPATGPAAAPAATGPVTA